LSDDDACDEWRYSDIIDGKRLDVAIKRHAQGFFVDTSVQGSVVGPIHFTEVRRNADSAVQIYLELVRWVQTALK